MEDNLIVAGDTPVTYKFWKKHNSIAIYISECGGVATLSQKGLFFRVPRKSLCPAMKERSRPAYPLCAIGSYFGVWKPYAFYIHRAVAEVYLRPKNIFEIEVDHLDGNHDNYHVLNLEWVTHEENIRRAVEMRRKRKGASAHTDVYAGGGSPQKGGVSK